MKEARERGERLPLERLIVMQTHKTARQIGLNDYRVLKPDYKTDLNAIDFDKLILYGPEVANNHTESLIDGRGHHLPDGHGLRDESPGHDPPA